MSQSDLDAVQALLGKRPYRVVRLLGRGGMSAVYVVEHEFLGRQFALKVLKPKHVSDPLYVERMRVEARAMARLRHPSVVEVVDFWTSDDGAPCVLMELLHGVTLAEELAKRKRLTVPDAVEIAFQTLSALSAGHAVGIVHRDIKPENLFLHQAPDGRVLKVLDYGIARVMPDTPLRGLRPVIPTESGTLIGTPRYMSPQARRGRKVDHREDLYALGIVLYVMLAGRGPFDGGESLEPPSRYAREVSSKIDEIVIHAIQDDPERRFQSAEDFLAALRPHDARDEA